MENIKVLRRQELETKEIMVGDQITVSLAKIGDFTATAQKITDKGVLFIFDEYITKRPMNRLATNEGGYEKSDLKVWIDTVLFEAFPEGLKSRICDLSIPTVGELFGHDDNNIMVSFELDKDEQLLLMKKRRNRMTCLYDKEEFGWLRNSTNGKLSPSDFAIVTGRGYANCYYASYSIGVRPVFAVG